MDIEPENGETAAVDEQAKPYPVSAPPPSTGYPPPGRTSGLAVASMVCGICGILWTMGLSGIVGLFLGYSARKQIRAERRSGSGMATAGIVMGWICVALWALFIIVIISVLVV